MAAALITGSNRGLSLEWVQQCAARGWRVLGSCREPDAAEDLKALASAHLEVTLHGLDLTTSDQIAALTEELRDELRQLPRPLGEGGRKACARTGFTTLGSDHTRHTHDLDALHKEIRSRGYKYYRPEISMAPWGSRVFEVIDPFSNKVLFNDK